MQDLIWVAVAYLGWLPYTLVRGRQELHILQLEEYETARYFRWLTGRPALGLDRSVLTGELLLVFLAFSSFAIDFGFNEQIASAGWAAMHLLSWYRQRRRDTAPEKKALVWTARVKRMVAVTLVIANLVLLAGIYSSGWTISIALLLLLLAGQLSGYFLLLGNLAAYPIEAGYRRYYLYDARRILKKYGPRVVGVAGSYGKTSTKEIIAALLGAHASTLKPPGNFNTLMGVCRVIRERLTPDYRYFVVEMGDYRRGDIRDLCRLVSPEAGIITAIGPEHLDRFGSIENVEKTKFELIEELPAGGAVALNVDDPRLRAMAERTGKVKVLRFGLDPAFAPDLWAENIHTGPDGISFDLVRDGKDKIALSSQLLGRHNVANLMGGIAIALELGVPIETIAATVPSITAAEHRLQLIKNPGGVTVIDDAYNSNPSGVRAALNVLGEFPARNKVLVTPGMIELGDIEAEENRKFGEEAAAVCSHVVLVGPLRTKPIAAGLESAGFPAGRISVVRNLEEATAKLREILGSGDVVLFSNDLPDQYNE